MEEICRVEIPQHIRQVKISNKQQPIYYEWNGLTIRGKKYKIPKKYFKDKSKSNDLKENIIIEYLKDEFSLGLLNKKKEVILSTRNSTTKFPLNTHVILLQKGIPIIANDKVVGTPKIIPIKGQDFYSSNIREFTRGIIMNAIKECYEPFLNSFPVINAYPIRIVCEIHDTIKNYYDNTDKEGLGKAWDVDNYAYPYMKAFPDVLQALGKIRNDDRLHITQPPSPIFVPIENHNDRKLVFIIYKDDREIINQNKIYNEFHTKIVQKEGTTTNSIF